MPLSSNPVLARTTRRSLEGQVIGFTVQLSDLGRGYELKTYKGREIVNHTSWSKSDYADHDQALYAYVKSRSYLHED